MAQIVVIGLPLKACVKNEKSIRISEFQLQRLSKKHNRGTLKKKSVFITIVSWSEIY